MPHTPWRARYYMGFAFLDSQPQRCVDCLVRMSNMLLVLSITFHCHYYIWGCMCSTGPQTWKLKNTPHKWSELTPPVVCLDMSPERGAPHTPPYSQMLFKYTLRIVLNISCKFHSCVKILSHKTTEPSCGSFISLYNHVCGISGWVRRGSVVTRLAPPPHPPAHPAPQSYSDRI